MPAFILVTYTTHVAGLASSVPAGAYTLALCGAFCDIPPTRRDERLSSESDPPPARRVLDMLTRRLFHSLFLTSSLSLPWKRVLVLPLPDLSKVKHADDSVYLYLYLYLQSPIYAHQAQLVLASRILGIPHFHCSEYCRTSQSPITAILMALLGLLLYVFLCIGAMWLSSAPALKDRAPPVSCLRVPPALNL
ncbi:hypothetical protein C8R44DRAFT_822337 [Mycena epipterygia]|nr:hypothetical protein C8R44DRAFT_822337 [Mycena epipterygia]